MTLTLLAHAGHSHDRPPVEPEPTAKEEIQPSPTPVMVHQEIAPGIDPPPAYPMLDVGTFMVFALVATPIVLITAKNKMNE
ncbi:hypothetical protein PJF56_09800 [Roseofilum sp. BLCC_M91]|uniref:Uncharacterized protein n=1 Tax=Roseofilum halophilum BLCC-M91 TaxID=3022259 RepID=A0ABT7BIZ0_9CYAN|nr:hypothetical protein [Roseofilum halophilum]MDJ1179159.1 hypothetical protein [Roseofilum halophilum BLCC-M91]